MTDNTMAVLLKEGTKVLEEAGISESALDAWILLEFVTGVSRAHYYANQEEVLGEEQVQQYRELIAGRADRIPLQHLTHQAFFMGYEFYVDGRVLIPRQDTETLVEEALSLLSGKDAPVIMDMCTGSGCILLSLLKELPGSTGIGIDASDDALTVAQMNRKALGLEERARFLQSDLFGIFDKNGGDLIQEYDMLISNPPYIRREVIGELMEEVQFHDPMMALDGGEDGLMFYRKITEEGWRFLKEGAWLLYEIGYDQGEEVSCMMREAGYENVAVVKDLAGLDRVVKGRKPRTGGTNV